jgi:hypothetical protein
MSVYTFILEMTKKKIKKYTFTVSKGPINGKVLYESFHEKEDKSVTWSIQFQKNLKLNFLSIFFNRRVSSFTWDTRKDNFFWNEMDNLISSPKCVTDVMLTKKNDLLIIIVYLG